MSHCKPYPAYRDSGLEFIGQVPEHWQRGKVAWDMKMSIGWTPPTGNRSYYGGPHNWVSIADLSAGRISETKQTLTDAAIAEMRGTQAPAGSLLFSYKLSIGEVALLEQPAYTNEAIAAFHPCNRVHMPFWKYAAPVILPRYSRMNIYGSELLNQELMNSARMAIPDVCEQQEIANALDRETARIDALITKKTRFIELLKEKRQALITHAVTKGLDPNVKLRDSEVEWRGQIPTHWEDSKLGYVASEQGGKTPSTENPEYWDGNVPWVSPKDMKVSVISDSIDHITSLAVEECGMAMIPKDAVLVVVRGMILAHSFPVAETGKPVTINQDMKALVPIQDMLSTYLRLVLQSAKSYVVSVLVAEAAHGTRVLRTDIWKQLPVAFPPVAEQRLIIEHIEAVSRKYDRLASKTQRSIDLLKERRAAFITAAVTGQIDLRESA